MVSKDDVPSARLRAAIAALEVVALDGSARRSAVAERGDCSPSTASRTLKYMEFAGWLTREDDQSHTYTAGDRGETYAKGLRGGGLDFDPEEMPDLPDLPE